MNETVDASWRSEWVSRKISIAKRLAVGEAGGGYAEAALILCGVLNALAAELWPGKRKDKKRFVELLVRFADPSLAVTKISVPVLIGHLREHNFSDDEQRLLERERLADLSPPRIVTGVEIDMPESEVEQLCSSLQNFELRHFCYATLLYEEIRSGYAHEYAPGARSSSWQIGGHQPGACVSYLNRRDPPDRQIHFNVQWLYEIAASVEINSRDQAPDPCFKAWWLPSKTDNGTTGRPS